MNATEANESPGVRPVSDRLLDQLVDGSLDPLRRRELLAALDKEPGAWRRCAMAFLEAQAWGAALDADRSTAWAAAATPRRQRGIGFARFSGIAAAVTLAFLTGFAASNRPPTEKSPTSYALTPPPVATASTPVETAPPPPPAPALPAYVLRQLEREGYEVRGDQKLVPVALADGRQVAVPVETLKYRFVGYRVH